MNFKDSYKKDNENIKPRKEVLISLSDKVKNNKEYRGMGKGKFNYKLVFSIVAVLLIVSILFFYKEKIGLKNILANNISDNIKAEPSKDGIYVPKQELGRIDANIQARRIPTLVYKGRVYTIQDAELPLEVGKDLMDKKIGVTWNLMSEIQDNGTSVGYVDLESLKDFATFSEGDEVYTAKGYDEGFRLITYTKNEYGEYVSLWECLNDFILIDGSGVFGMMNIKDNLESATWKSFNNWNNGIIEEKEVTIDDIVNNFIDAMYKGIPYSLEDESLRSELFDKEENQKFIFLKMKDGTKTEIRLFKNGYVYYSGLNFVFKLDEENSNNMWNKLN